MKQPSDLLTCFVLISIFYSVLAGLQVLCLHVLPLASEELLRLRFCLGFVFCFLFCLVEGAMRVLFWFSLLFFFTSFPCNLFIGAWLGQQKYPIALIFDLALKRKC